MTAGAGVSTYSGRMRSRHTENMAGLDALSAIVEIHGYMGRYGAKVNEDRISKFGYLPSVHK